jgi:hypothetical protein
MTNKIYRFRGFGFIVMMDKRDWNSIQDPRLKRVQ